MQKSVSDVKLTICLVDLAQISILSLSQSSMLSNTLSQSFSCLNLLSSVSSIFLIVTLGGRINPPSTNCGAGTLINTLPNISSSFIPILKGVFECLGVAVKK